MAHVKTPKFQSKQHCQDEKGYLPHEHMSSFEIALSDDSVERPALCPGGKAYDRIKKDANLKVLLENYNLMVPWDWETSDTVGKKSTDV